MSRYTQRMRTNKRLPARLTMTLDPRVRQVVARIARAGGRSQARVIDDTLVGALPIFERVACALEEAERLLRAEKQVPKLVGQSMARAHTKLEKLLGSSIGIWDEGLAPLKLTTAGTDGGRTPTRPGSDSEVAPAPQGGGRRHAGRKPPRANRGVR
jgi:hypothetical protein